LGESDRGEEEKPRGHKKYFFDHSVVVVG